MFHRLFHRFSSTPQGQRRNLSFIENRKKRVWSSWIIGGKGTSQIPPPIKVRARNIKNMLSVVGLVGAIFLLSSRSVPIPHLDRKRRALFSPGVETFLGKVFCYVMLQSASAKIVDPNHPVAKHLERIGDKITESNGLPKHTYVLIDEPIVNAFVLPGKYVFVYTGILPVLKNQSGAAMVISHELSHCLAGHSLDRLVFNLPVGLSSLLIGSWVGSLSHLFIELPNSRNAEIEADTIGVHLMTHACFDSKEAYGVFERLHEVGPSHVGVENYLSTHPPDELRINNIKSILEKDDDVKSNLQTCGVRDFSYPAHNFLVTYHYPESFPRISPKQFEDLLPKFSSPLDF